MANSTGTPQDDFILIALAEYLIILFFLLVRSSHYARKDLSYAGDNQNVAAWAKYRKPKNRIAQYFTRISNRFGTENDCTFFPRYISSGDNKFCAALSRLSGELGCKHGRDSGYQFAGVVTAPKWFLTDRLHTKSLGPPTDHPDRVQRIKKFGEKRMVRSIPHMVKESCRVALLGLGVTKWGQVA